MSRLRATVLGASGLLVGSMTDHPAGAAVYLLAAFAFPAIALSFAWPAEPRDRRLEKMTLALGVGMVVVAIGMRLLRGVITASGWPAALGLQLVGLGIVPLLALPAAYARWFDVSGLSEKDLARLRARARRE